MENDASKSNESPLPLSSPTQASLRLPGIRHGEARQSRPSSARPGIEHMTGIDQAPEAGHSRMTCIDYAADRVEMRTIEDLDALLEESRPDWAPVRWINIDGLHPYVVNRFRQKFDFHTLAAEDVLNVPQRPKLETYEQYLFIVARALMPGEGKLVAEQISFFVYKDTLITFQERHGDVWGGIRKRINTEGSRLRTHGVGYLLYALLDAIVDQCFPILEQYGDLLEKLEEVAIERPTPRLQQRIHGIKRQLVILRRVMWPTRELIDTLHRDEHQRFDEFVCTYMRDVYDHCVQVLDVIETYREMAGSLTDLYMSAVSNRMNEVMKVLTLMASFFIPITFLAGVYGMNFDHIPELHWQYSYTVFWVLVAGIVSTLAWYFWRKGWIGGGGADDSDLDSEL